MWKRSLVWLITMMATAALFGCDEDWGDKAAKFVDKEAHGLSEAYVRAHLPRVWLDAFLESNMDAVVEVKAIGFQIESATPAAADDLASLDAAALLKRFNENDIALSSIIDASVRIDRLRATIAAQGSICSDRAFFDSRGLGNIGIVGPLSTIMPRLAGSKGDFTIYVSYGTGGSDNSGMWTALGQLATSLFNAGRAKEQNDKLEAAIQKLPAVVVQADEAFAISQPVCLSELTGLAELRAVVASAISDLPPALEARQRDILLARDLVASYLRPLEIQQFLSDSGVVALLSSIQRSIADGQLGAEFEINLKEIMQLAEDIQHTTGCIARLSKVEEFDDAVVELLAQVRVFSTKASSAKLSARLREALSALSDLHAVLPNMYKRAAAEACT
jgi:hypothetical protein